MASKRGRYVWSEGPQAILDYHCYGAAVSALLSANIISYETNKRPPTSAPEPRQLGTRRSSHRDTATPATQLGQHLHVSLTMLSKWGAHPMRGHHDQELAAHCPPCERLVTEAPLAVRGYLQPRRAQGGLGSPTRLYDYLPAHMRLRRGVSIAATARAALTGGEDRGLAQHAPRGESVPQPTKHCRLARGGVL